MNNNIKNKIRINRLKEDNNILKKCQIKYNYFGRDHQNITMKGTKKYKNENGEYYLKNHKKEEKIILNTNKKSSNTNNLPNDKINSNGKSKNNNYNANNQFIKVKKKKLFKDELTTIPDVKPKNKISAEHEKKYVSKAIVHTKYSRRYQYSNNIRNESKKELEFVTKYCNDLGVMIESTTFEKKSKLIDYNEQELREKRYQYFENIINKHNADYLMTAHHGDDLIETILMRLTRGSNLKGYCGIQIETKKKNIKLLDL